jgi:hypothetical protein
MEPEALIEELNQINQKANTARRLCALAINNDTERRQQYEAWVAAEKRWGEIYWLLAGQGHYPSFDGQKFV